MTIELNPEIEARLRETAAREGLSVEDYLSNVMNRLAPSIASSEDDEYDDVPLPATPAEAFAYWKRVGALGVFDGRGDALEIARQLRDDEEAVRPGFRRRRPPTDGSRI